MARRLRYLPEGSLVEITCRTVQGRLLLHPSPHFNELALGALGRAQARARMRVHVFVILSRHLHVLASPESPQQLAGFMAFVEANPAKEATSVSSSASRPSKTSVTTSRKPPSRSSTP